MVSLLSCFKMETTPYLFDEVPLPIIYTSKQGHPICANRCFNDTFGVCTNLFKLFSISFVDAGKIKWVHRVQWSNHLPQHVQMKYTCTSDEGYTTLELTTVALGGNLLTYVLNVTNLEVFESEVARTLEFHCNFLKSAYPKHVISALKESKLNKDQVARKHPNVSIVFADIVGFTSLCSKIDPEYVMEFLNCVFERFDEVLAKHGLFKLDTVGDCYVAVMGLMDRIRDNGYACIENSECLSNIKLMGRLARNAPRRSFSAPNLVITTNNAFMKNACDAVSFAKDLVVAASTICMPFSELPLQVRVGVHSGPVTSGIIDSNMMRFDLFGDSMNVASRMESTSLPNQVHISNDTYRMLIDVTGFEKRETEVKGKGGMTTYMFDCSELIKNAPQREEVPSSDHGENVMSFLNLALQTMSGTFLI